jgi:hypothetical protein
MLADTLTISVDIAGATVHAARLEPREVELNLSSKTGVKYILHISRLHGIVNQTADWWIHAPRAVLIRLQKAQAGPYWPSLLEGGARLPQMGVDWSRWVDERTDGVKWNERADRPWEWWQAEKKTADDIEDGRVWGDGSAMKDEA